MEEVRLSYGILECVGLALAVAAAAYGTAWYGFRAKTRWLCSDLDKSQEETKALNSRLRQVEGEKSDLAEASLGYRETCEVLSRRDAEIAELGRKLEALERQWTEREEEQTDAVETPQGGEARVFVREWTGFYQVIIKSFLNVPVRAQGHIRIARMLERHHFDITIDPKEEYPELLRTLPGSPVA